jgi:hypothetical protein
LESYLLLTCRCSDCARVECIANLYSAFCTCLFDDDTLKRMVDHACSGLSIMSSSMGFWSLSVRAFTTMNDVPFPSKPSIVSFLAIIPLDNVCIVLSFADGVELLTKV